MSKKQQPLRVFIGTSPGGQDNEACAVLEASLRRRASVPVELSWLRPSEDPKSPTGGWNSEQWRTPWTALRWAVPELCAWRGRAMYLDCPAVVTGDVRELAEAEIPSRAFLLARREEWSVQTGCLVFDCAEARKYLRPIAELKADVGAHQAIGEYLSLRPALVAPLPFGWGWSDRAWARDPDPPDSGSVHFISPSTQPHGPRADARLVAAGRSHWFGDVRLPHYCARLVELWEQEYASVIAEGFSGRCYGDEG